MNGYQISVAESLDNALRYMRHGGNRIPVWADAICVNQSDRDEKPVQVKLMGDIYAQGKRLMLYVIIKKYLQPKAAYLVWIWLGKPADNSDCHAFYP